MASPPENSISEVKIQKISMRKIPTLAIATKNITVGIECRSQARIIGRKQGTACQVGPDVGK